MVAPTFVKSESDAGVALPSPETVGRANEPVKEPNLAWLM